MLSAIGGDKALSCMFPVNVKSHPENQFFHCVHSDCLISVLKISNTTLGTVDKVRILSRKYTAFLCKKSQW